MPPPERRGSAAARTALAGNPSDGYGGAVLALALPAFEAQALARPAPALKVEPASELVQATVQRFARECTRPAAIATNIRWSTSIPRGVGLAGSSAIVIATLRALCQLHGVTLPPAELATLALAVETEELEIVAGLQDRVAQSYGALTFMDFAQAPRYERLDPSVLPALLVAWRPETACDSGPLHAGLRARFERGDPVVTGGIAKLASAAHAARGALLTGDVAGFARSVDATFDARREMMQLDPRHLEMIEAARACGASANYTGSGGAIVAVCRDEAQRQAVRQALVALGCRSSTAGSTSPAGSRHCSEQERAAPGRTSLR